MTLFGRFTLTDLPTTQWSSFRTPRQSSPEIALQVSQSNDFILALQLYYIKGWQNYVSWLRSRAERARHSPTTGQALIGSAGVAAAVEFTVFSTTVVPYVHVALEGDLMDDDRNIRTALVTVPDVGRTRLIESDDDVYGRLDGGISFDAVYGFTGTVSGETTFSREAGDEQAIMGTITGRF
jgi:hypothetical protein